MRGPIAFQVLCAVSWLALAASSSAAPEAPPVQARMNVTEAWMGQKVVMSVELLSPTSFAGSPRFQIPRVPGAIVMKSAESPVLSSRTIDDQEYFVQLHEILIYSQREGEVRIPPITVRFGITGDPPAERQGPTTGFTFTSKRPPGTEELGSVITTTSLSVTESWDSKPTGSGEGTGATAMTGDAFVRTVVMKAADLPGMLLPSLPAEAPEGLRIYPREPLVEDRSQRGDFTGTRTQTYSYLCAAPGRYTLPELSFPWWDPVNKTLQTETLPALSFTVLPNPAVAGTKEGVQSGAGGSQALQIAAGVALLAVMAFLSLVAWRSRHRIAAAWHAWQASESVKFRELRRACRGTDATAALRAYHDWLRAQPAESRPAWDALTSSDAKLGRELRELQAVLFSDQAGNAWNGTALASALTDARGTMRARMKSTHRRNSTTLAPLNPD